jgi:hypothetical protein
MRTKFQSEKPEGKRLLGRPRRRYEDNIRTNLNRNRVRSCGLDSSDSGQGTVAGCCEHLGSIKGEEFD